MLVEGELGHDAGYENKQLQDSLHGHGVVISRVENAEKKRPTFRLHADTQAGRLRLQMALGLQPFT